MRARTDLTLNTQTERAHCRPWGLGGGLDGCNIHPHNHYLQALTDAGVPLAFGTDYPVEPVTPFRGLYAAVTRQSEDGKKSYYPAQKLTIEQAIAAYTTGAAFAEFAEKEKGRLEPGMLADFIVLRKF